jgi:hypothetical protein
MLASAELAASAVTTLLSLAAPLLTVLAVALVALAAAFYLRRGRTSRPQANPA